MPSAGRGQDGAGAVGADRTARMRCVRPAALDGREAGSWTARRGRRRRPGAASVGRSDGRRALGGWDAAELAACARHGQGPRASVAATTDGGDRPAAATTPRPRARWRAGGACATAAGGTSDRVKACGAALAAGWRRLTERPAVAATSARWRPAGVCVGGSGSPTASRRWAGRRALVGPALAGPPGRASRTRAVMSAGHWPVVESFRSCRSLPGRRSAVRQSRPPRSTGPVRRERCWLVAPTPGAHERSGSRQLLRQARRPTRSVRPRPESVASCCPVTTIGA